MTHSEAATIAIVLAIGLFTSVAAARHYDTVPNLPRDAHGRILRHSSAETTFKKSHPCPATGKSTGPCPGYVMDHIIPLYRGGADEPQNLQWQTTRDAKAKDRVE